MHTPDSHPVSYVLNFLDLPQKVIKDASNYIEYFYDASARKVMQKVVTSGVATERFYHNGFEYGASGIELVHTGEGVVNVSTSDNNHRYNYFLKDHLGSTRVVFGEDTQGELIVNQVTDYYAFGLAHDDGFGMGDTRYLYNGKELQDELNLGQNLSLGWLDYGWRMYDPQIGRWHVIDPLAEKYSSYSPYNYVLNNPVRYIDPDGRRPRTYELFAGIWQLLFSGDDTDQRIQNQRGGYSVNGVMDSEEGTIGSGYRADYIYGDWDATEPYHPLIVLAGRLTKLFNKRGIKEGTVSQSNEVDIGEFAIIETGDSVPITVHPSWLNRHGSFIDFEGRHRESGDTLGYRMITIGSRVFNEQH